MRKKVNSLIRDTKRKHFTVSVQKQKRLQALLKRFLAVNNGSKSSENSLPDEIEIEFFNDSQSVAATFNVYFTSLSTILINKNSSNDYDVNITYFNKFINDQIPSDVYFPFVTSEQVQSHLKVLDTSKATGLDRLGP